MAKILWLDNDRAYTVPFVDYLHTKGYETTVVETPSEAEDHLKKHDYDLVIVDVMVPTKSAKEEEAYQPSETALGYKTGLVFYRRHKDSLKRRNIRVLVHTVRLDKVIKDEFYKAGLKSELFSTKYELQDVGEFLEKIQAVLQ